MQSGTYPRRAVERDCFHMETERCQNETNSAEYSIMSNPQRDITEWLYDPEAQTQPGFAGETLRALLAEYGIN